MRKASTALLEQGTQTPSPAPDLIPAEISTENSHRDWYSKRGHFTSLLSAVKLVIMPLIVYGLCVSLGLDPLYTIAAVICAAVPTAKTAYILAGEYHCEEMLVASTVSMTTLASVVSLVAWLYGLSGLAARIPVG